MKIIIIIMGLFISCHGFGQAVEITTIDNVEIVRLLNGAVSFSTNKTNDLYFKVYTLSNEPGSAGYANGEVTEKLYIAVSEDGEWPDQKVYVVGSFYAPKVIKWDNKNSKHPEFTIEYGEYNAKKKLTFIIGLDKITQKK
jgi:hypothetical protein